MSKKIKKIRNVIKPIGSDFFDHVWEESWTYIKTVVDVVHEPVLILDKNLCVMAANETFYKLFQVEPKDTEGRVIYELGNGQWNTPSLRKLLEDILPKNTFFKGFEVTHEFPNIGYKSMILNARQIHFSEEKARLFPSIILLAMEDVTEMMAVAETLAVHTKQFEARLNSQTKEMALQIIDLKNQIKKLQKKIV